MKHRKNSIVSTQEKKTLVYPLFVFILLVSIVFHGSGQTTLWSENFESSNSLTLLQGSQTNYWWRGSGTYSGGSYSLYITNNSSTNTYNIGASSVSHAYRDITFPAGATNINLTFSWKGQGESGYDWLHVFLVPTATTITAGTELTGQLGTYNLSAGFTPVTLSLGAVAGTTQRLVFSWRNDGSVGTDPPAAIDDISVTCTLPAPGCGNTNLGVITPSACTPQDAAYSSGTIPYWSFTATAGQTYNFSLGSNSEDSYLYLYNSSLTQLTYNDDSGPFYSGTPSSLSWTCTTGGTYYISAAHYTCTAFTNSGNLKYWSTPAPYGSTSPTFIYPTASWQNQAYSSGSMYVYFFTATAGYVYDFSLCSNAEDSYIRIYNSSWDLQNAYDDNGPWCAGVPASASWTAASSGNYIVAVNHFSCSGFSNAGTLAYKYSPSCVTPGTPVSLSGSGTGTTTASLSWAAGSPTGSATVTYYWNVYTSGGSFVTSGNTTGTSATAGGLSCGTSYYFTVYANTNCNGASSGTATSGTFSTSACVPAAALNFDGTNDLVTVATTPSISAPYTIEFWAKPESTGTCSVLGSRSGGAGNLTFDVKFSGGTTIHGDIGNGSAWLSTAADAPLSYSVGTWYHIAYAVTTSGYTIYINGTQSATGTFTGTPLLCDNSNKLAIGAYCTGGGEYFDGDIDEIRIWNYARTQAQIQANLNCEQLSQSGLVALYHFNQGNAFGSNPAITSLTDASGNGYAGTLNNFTLAGSTSNWVAPGGVTTGNACVLEMMVPSTGNNSYTSCSGHLYDNGGSSADYGNNQDGYTIIYPSNPSQAVQLSGSFVTEGCCEHIYIYNGAGTGGTLLYNGGAGTGSIGTIISSGANVPLTVRFTTDVSVVYSGFDFTISCVTPCAATLTNSGPTLSCTYTDVSYTVTPSGFSGTPTYQWYYSNADGSSVVPFGASSGSGSAPYYTSYSGGTSQTLNINTFGGAYDHMHVWCVATYGGCNATSNNIALVVTDAAPTAPVAATHTLSQTQIIWNWSAVAGATGYKWNTTNNYATATDMGASLSKTETGLTCNTSYTRYIWAYKACGRSPYTTLTATTSPCCTTPAVSAMSATICTGAAFTVAPVNGTNGTVPAGTTYSWTAPVVAGISGTSSGTNAANISGTLVNNTAGSINVVYTVTPKSAACTGAPFTVTVTVLPSPAGSITPNPVPLFCYGSSQTLTANTGCGSPSYEWFRNGTTTGITTPTYAATIPGIYTVKVICNGCSAFSNAATVTVQSNEFALNVSQPATTGLSVGDYLWTGNTSIDWAVASNWLVYNGSGIFSVATVIPDSSKNVLIRAYTGCASNLCNILNNYTAHCKSITIESSLTMGTASLLNVARNWNNNLGTLNHGTGTVAFNGQKLITGAIYTGGVGAGKQFYNVEIKSVSNTSAGSNDGNKVNLESNIRINNNFVLTSGYQFNVNSASTMSIGGNFTHNICEFNRGLGSVTLTGTAKLIDGAAVTYFRILNISGSYTLTEPSIYLWSNPLGDYGDLNILAGGSLNATNKDIFIDGSWTNNGTFIAGTGSVLFTRGYDQFIFSGGSRFYNVFVAKDAALPYLTILDPAWITNHGGFGMGIVNFSGTGSLTFTDNASSDDGSPLSYVDGPVIKEGNESFVFPIGDETAHPVWQPHVWAPLILYNDAGAITDKFTCEYFFTAAPNNYNAWNMCDYTALHHVSGMEYWMLNRNSGTSTPNVGLFWKNADRSGITNVSEVVVAHYEPCPMPAGPLKWKAMTTSASGTTGPTGTGLAIGSGFTNYSPITFGTKTNSNPLPVSLLDFTAECNGGGVEVHWSTATETNNDHFIVERSQDATNWQTVTTVQGAGNSNSSLNYQVLDAQPYGGTSFYRLRQVDYNGQSETFSAVAVKCNEGQPSVSFYPNPFTSGLSIDMVNIGSGKATLIVYDMLGQKVLAKNLVSNELTNGTLILDLEPLAKGLYTIEFRSDSYSKIAKIVKN